jgi:perosamine synthetase
MTANRRNSIPAALGGEPLFSESIPQYNTIGAAEKRAVMEVLDSGELSGFVASPGPEFWGGPKVRKIQQQFCDHFGVAHALGVNSATSGLHCALAALDVGPGDEVIVPPYTMTATATTPFMLGALPVFADIEDRTFGLNPDAVRAAITEHTRGIVAVNLFGHAARLDELRAIADERGLFLIEDNAQAPDAIYRGRRTGTIGDAAVFSFNRHKTLQCGEGGMVLTNDADVARKVALFRNHGEGVVADLDDNPDLVNTAGLNYRMTEMEAAVAGVQFERVGELNQARIALARRLSEGLAALPGITPPVEEPECNHVYYFHVSKFDAEVAGMDRNAFVRGVAAEGLPIRAGYVKPIYLEPMYQQRVGIGRSGFPFSTHPRHVDYSVGLCPTVERLQDRDLFLTNFIFPPLTNAHMDTFVDACARVLEHAQAINEWAANQPA